MIGYDYKVVKKKVKGMMETFEKGSKGIQCQSNLVVAIEKDNTREVENYLIKEEIKYSYLDLFYKYLYIQVWECNRWSINKLLGARKIRLLDLVTGPCRRSEPLGIRGGGKSVSDRCFQLGFSVLFEEDWKFAFTLKDINIEGYSQKYQESISSTKINFAMKSKGFGSQEATTCKINGEFDNISSDVMYWPELQHQKDFTFEGTWTKLRNKKLEFKIIEYSNAGPNYENQKPITLLTLDNYIFLNSVKRIKKIEDDKKIGSTRGLLGKLDVTNMMKGDSVDPRRVARSTYAKSAIKSQVIANWKKKMDNDSLSDGMIYTKLNAMVTFEPKPPKESDSTASTRDSESSGVVKSAKPENFYYLPMFNHSTPYVQYKSNKFFLLVEISRVSGIISPDSIGIINSFVEVDWNSQVQRTAIIKDSYSPNFAEQLLFKVNTNKKLINDKSIIDVDDPETWTKENIEEFKELNKAYLEELNGILYEAGPIEITVWLDNMGKNNEFSGTSTILLREYCDIETDVFVKYDWKENKLKKVKCFSKQMTVHCNNATKANHNMTMVIKIAFLPPELVL